MLDFLLCESVDDLKGECTCMKLLREIVHEVTWIAAVVTRSIKSVKTKENLHDITTVMA